MNLRILIADDEPIIRMGLKSMLQEMGHSVTAASNGREALRMARNRLFDLAILDVKMPFTDGLQAAKVLSGEHGLPIILLTAYSEQDLIERASELPIQGYLVKPVQTGQLAAAIAVALKRSADVQHMAAQTAALGQALEERKVIERAKGKLMAGGMSEAQAHRAIQRRARERRESMVQVARRLLNEG
ncbi:MAG TPA: response regulator [Candidatus Sulfomarinibacteraceae bacterium]|nr:response regulator [Candidatus Sulfomarinibacteraceae bacterium]